MVSVYVIIVVTPIFVSWWGKAIAGFLRGKVDRFVISIIFAFADQSVVERLAIG
jgi:hypothetical protein